MKTSHIYDIYICIIIYMLLLVLKKKVGFGPDGLLNGFFLHGPMVSW